MKQFGAFVLKEFYHIARDRRSMMILLGMPIIFIILFGFAISTEVRNVRLGVMATTHDEVVRQLTERLANNAYFTYTHTFDNYGEIDEALQRGEVDVVVVFEADFYERLMHDGMAQVQIVLDASDPNMATIIKNYTTSIITSYASDISDGSIHAGVVIIPSARMLYNPQMKSAYNFVPGVMGLILMLICAMMTSISIVREKERGTMEILLVSPIRPIYIIIAKTVPYFTLSMVNLATILLLAVFILGVPITGNLWLLIVVSLLFILVGLALGLLISTLVRTQIAAMLVSGMVLMMPVMILSGMLFPIDSMPVPLQWLSNVIPARWYIAAVKKVMIEGLGFAYIWRETAILAGMAVVIVVGSLFKFKHRLE